MTELNPARITRALVTLRDSAPQAFGAEVHGFQLNPALDEAVVATFEQRYGIRLPEDYRSFLTSTGNGGAGPFYGVFPLGNIDDSFDLRKWEDTDIGILSQAFPFNKEWNDLSGKPEDNLLERDEAQYWKQMEGFEHDYWDPALVNGAFPICHQGCALRILLVVSGDQAGYLWNDLRAEGRGLMPVHLEDGTRATFSAWYDEWLKELDFTW